MFAPVAVTEKLTAEPAQIVCALGCCAIVVIGLTVSVALEELAVPQEPLTTQRYKFPDNPKPGAVNVYVVFVAPVILDQLLPPSVLTCH